MAHLATPAHSSQTPEPMVRHGTLRKRRSGRKVTRKAPKHNAMKIKSSVTDLYLKQNWDTSKSPKENLLSMGLNPNPNQSLNATFPVFVSTDYFDCEAKSGSPFLSPLIRCSFCSSLTNLRPFKHCFNELTHLTSC
jgi:hypothetical protein